MTQSSYRSTDQQEIEALSQQLVKMQQLLAVSKRLDGAVDERPGGKAQIEALLRRVEEKEREIKRLKEFEYLHKNLIKQRQESEAAQSHQAAEVQRLNASNKSLEQWLTQSETECKTLKNRLEGAQQEVHAKTLEAAHHQAQARTFQVQVEQQAAELQVFGQQAQTLQSDFTKSEADKSDLYQELEALTQQCEKLRQATSEAQGQLSHSKSQLQEAQAAVATLSEERRQQEELIGSQLLRHSTLEQALHEATEQLEQQRQVSDLKQQETNLRLEVLEELIERDKDQRKMLLDKVGALNQELAAGARTQEILSETITGAISQRDSLKQSLDRREEEFDTTLRHQQELNSRIEQLEEDLQQQGADLEKALKAQQEADEALRRSSAQALQRNQKIESLSDQLSMLEREKGKLEENLGKARRSLEERDVDVNAAQQHLAKKVKEASRLMEQQEETERRADRLQKELNDNRTTLDSLKTDIQRLQRREKQLGDQLQEQVQTYEAKIAKWEQEYFKAVEQWQESEATVNKLRQIQQKHQQLRALLTDSALAEETKTPLAPPVSVSPSQPSAAPVEPMPLRETSTPVKPPTTTSGTIKVSDADLFSLPKTPARIRQNLFD